MIDLLAKPLDFVEQVFYQKLETEKPIVVSFLIVLAYIVFMLISYAATSSVFGDTSFSSNCATIFADIIMIGCIIFIAYSINKANQTTVNYKKMDNLDKVLVFLSLYFVFVWYTVAWSGDFSNVFVYNKNTWSSLLLALVFAPIAEELVFRYGIFSLLSSTKLSPIFAAIISSVIFAGLHGTNIALFFPLTFLGIALCYIYYITSNIFLSMWMHCLFNLCFVLLNRMNY